MVGAGLGGSGYSREGTNIPMTIHAALFSPSFLWKEVPRRGGGWPRETVLPHSGKPTPPRFARLPLPEEGARNLCHSRSRTHAFPICVAHLSAFLICLSCRLCPIRPCGAPSPRGEGCDTRIPSSKKAAKPPPYNKDPSTSVGMTGGRRIVSHSLSHRLVDPSCTFGAPLL